MSETRPPDPGAYEGEDQKPGSPPRPAVEPEGAEHAADTSKTQTDPHTGAPTEGRPDTAGAA